MGGFLIVCVCPLSGSWCCRNNSISQQINMSNPLMAAKDVEENSRECARPLALTPLECACNVQLRRSLK